MDLTREIEEESAATAPNNKTSRILVIVILFITALVTLSKISSSPTQRQHRNLINDVVILYAYEETPISRINAEFFLRHALHDEADFIFILNGPTDLDTLIPTASNIQIIHAKQKSCFGLGIYGQVLKQDKSAIVNKYNQFILMSAVIRGPFVPHWSSACWSSAFLGRLTDKVKVSLDIDHLRIKKFNSFFL